MLSQAKATIPLITVSLEAQLNRLDVLMGAQPGTYAAELTPGGRHSRCTGNLRFWDAHATYYAGDLTSSLPSEWLLPRTLALARLSPNTIPSSHFQASSGLKRSRPPISSSSKDFSLSVS